MSLFRKINGWLHRRRWQRKHGKIEEVSVLTKPVVCFERELEFSLPPGFRLYANEGDALRFESPYLHVSVQRVPFRRHIHSLTAREIVQNFRYAVPVLSMPALQRGYLRHSPTVSAQWKTRSFDLRTDTASLYLIAVQQTAFVFLMTGNEAVISRYPDLICASVQVHPDRVDARLRAEQTARRGNT